MNDFLHPQKKDMNEKLSHQKDFMDAISSKSRCLLIKAIPQRLWSVYSFSPRV